MRRIALLIFGCGSQYDSDNLHIADKFLEPDHKLYKRRQRFGSQTSLASQVVQCFEPLESGPVTDQELKRK
jgi:hypothetical protein